MNHYSDDIKMRVERIEKTLYSGDALISGATPLMDVVDDLRRSADRLTTSIRRLTMFAIIASLALAMCGIAFAMVILQ